jgi:hypothetical protein
MNRNILSLSWLNGQVKAVHVRGSKLVSSWICPTLTDRVEEFPQLLRDAVSHTGFRGKDVMVVVENRSLLYHLQEAPIGRKSLVRSFIERRVQQSRFFEDQPTCYGLNAPVPMKTNQRFLLTLLPRDWVISIREACLAQGYNLRAVFAPATVLTRQIQKLTASSNKPILLSADIGGSIALVVGRKDQVWFARSVAMSAAPSSSPLDPAKAGPTLKVVKAVARPTERLEQELNRTRLFCQQQFESTLDEFWVIGETAKRALENVKVPSGMSQQATDGPENEFLLAWETSQLSPRTPGNLLSQFHSEDVYRRRLAAVAVAAGLVFSVGFSGWINHLIKDRELQLQSIQSQIEESRTQHEETLSVWKIALQKQSFVASVGSPTDPPVPVLLLRYLGSHLPETFVLGRIDLNRATNRWYFRLEGRQMVSTMDFFTTLEAFERELTNSVFKAQIAASTRTRLFQESSTEIRGLTAAGAANDGEKPFFVEGVIP